MASHRLRGFCLLVAVLGFAAAAALGCGSTRNITRVTITVDMSALSAETRAAIKTVRLHVEGDRQLVDEPFAVPAGALAAGNYEVTYNPLSTTGTLHVVIYALDASGTVLATNTGDVKIKTGQNALVTVALSGTVSVPLLMSSPMNLDFGTVVLGQPSGRMMVMVRNAGGAPTGMLTAIMGGDTASFVVDPATTCDGTILMPNETCSLAIEFRPTEVGERMGRLALAASPGGETFTDLVGKGAAASLVAIDPDVVDLGAVQIGQTGPAATLTVRNGGGAATGELSVALSGAHAAEVQLGTDGCSGTSLEAGASCTVSVALHPSSAGAKEAALLVSGPAALQHAPAVLSLGSLAEGSLAVPAAGSALLTGMGLAAAALTIEPMAQDLGTVLMGGTSSATFAVKNPGGLATGPLMLSLAGANAAEMMLATDGCSGTSLPAGTSCSVTVNFTPTGVGAKTAELRAQGNPGGMATAALSATVAVPGALVIAPASIDFGGVLVSATSATIAFMVTNTGGTPSGALTLALGGGAANQFLAVTDGCTGQALAPAATCMVSYVFKPTTAGNKTASVVVSGMPGGVGAAALLGRGLAPAMLTANATAALGTVDVGTTGTPFVWTIRNVGDAASGPLMASMAGGASEFSVTNGCAGVLASGATCIMRVALAPTSPGDKAMILTVTGVPGGSVTLMASGTGRAAQQLGLMLAGNGSGSVTSNPAGINCGTTCGAGYRFGTVVTLTAAPAASSTFAGWSGACTGTGVCMVTMNAAQSVTATFTLNRYALSVKTSGTTTGTVTSAPAGIDCGADCSEAYNHGTMVALTATPASGWEFGGWAGACTGAGACSVAMTQARSVTATFTQGSFALSVSVTGNGKIASQPAGIDCGSDCGEAYPSGTTVVLTPTAAPGYTFTAWGGDCASVKPPGACTVTMSQARSVTGTFTANPEVLTVTLPGKGSGTVTSKPVGIDCASSARAPDCTETYPYGAMLTLIATPAAGMRIAGWSGGGCTGTAATCTVTMTDALTVAVDFEPQSFTLTVKKTGAGAAPGGVTANVGKLDCGTDCDEPYAYGNTVVLTALPAQGKVLFLGWDHPNCQTPAAGAAGPPLTCSVPITADVTVVARFEVYTGVTVRVSGTGTVTSTPAGISCGQTCGATFPSNSKVQLDAVPGALYKFVGWDAPCLEGTTGTTCTVQLGTTNVSVTAVFQLRIVLVPIDPPIIVAPQ